MDKLIRKNPMNHLADELRDREVAYNYARESIEPDGMQGLEGNLLAKMDGIAGIVESDGGRAENTGGEFTELLLAEKQRKVVQ